MSKKTSGFTLIEMMVAVTVFSVVMLVAAGSLLTVIDANRKALRLQDVLSSLNFALESMSRTARVGATYHGFPGIGTIPHPLTGPPIENPNDCSGSTGGTAFAFEPYRGDPNDKSDQVVYRLNQDTPSDTSWIERSTDGGNTWVPLTPPEVKITEFRVFVYGAKRTDQEQPRMRLRIRGSAGTAGRRDVSTFDIQTTITQRVLDIP